MISRESLASLRDTAREGNRPGHYFAPGCCHNPDYITQIPVLFEDGTFDVMRAINVRKTPDIPEESKKVLETLIHPSANTTSNP